MHAYEIQLTEQLFYKNMSFFITLTNGFQFLPKSVQKVKESKCFHACALAVSCI